MKTLACQLLLLCAMVLAACAPTAPMGPDRIVEIVLQEHLPDENRGWCIDAAGHQQGAIMEGGVHAHTCYSYEMKGIAVDQGFSERDMQQGSFRLVAFDHCLTMAIDQPDSWIALTPCDGRATQDFEMTEDGRILSMASPELCITLGPDTVFGGGGNPIHQIRAAVLDTCSDDRAVFQRWRVRDHKDW